MLGGNNQNNQQQQGQRRTTTGTRRTQHRVTPQMIEMVRAMFPDIPTAAILADLQRTGSVETTVDNALRDGGLPLPSPVPSQQGSPNASAINNSSTVSSSRKSPSHPNLVQRYKIDVQQDTDQEPPKVWEASPDKRQEILRKRKEFMVLQARKKLMEQQQKKKQEPTMEQGSSSAASSSMSVTSAEATAASQLEKEQEDEAKTFEDMSVDELNTLSPEQRRDQMLQALQRRTSGSS
ncbi:amfr protein [Mucor ambiguus]|uniref:Amfr protein n=1 Tax=Mucor ambiguus TaxID=91626 RepID=A0A0C9MGJ4_9FUNG|nr:amfr protein [Mucor ambiguus]